ncbi:UNVERIFIED_CONTAM: amidohydrolase [Campylobacter lari]
MNGEDIYKNALLGMAEMIKTGTTSFVDMYFFSERIADAAKISGIRAYIGMGFVNDSLEKRYEENINFFKNYNNTNDGLIHTIIAPHSVYANDDNSMKLAYKMSQETSKMVTIHLSESKTEVANSLKDHGFTPLEYADRMNLFENNTAIIAHAVHLTDKEIEIAKAKNLTLVHNITSNLKLSSGIMNAQELLKRGINVALGTDGAASNNTLDMFKELHIASLVSKGAFSNPTNLNSYETLKMATVNGAKGLGKDHELGKIAPNYLADLIIVDLKNINHTPINNVINSLVYSTYGNDVLTTIINGKVVYKDRKFVNLNIKEIMKNVSQNIKDLKRRKIQK